MFSEYNIKILIASNLVSLGIIKISWTLLKFWTLCSQIE